jgi:uncharacterized membrane protein
MLAAKLRTSTLGQLSRLQKLLLMLLVIGIFLRFLNLTHLVYWHDEVFTSMRITGHTSQQLAETFFVGQEVEPQALQTVQQFTPEVNLAQVIERMGIEDAQHPPLYYVTLRFWVQLLGNTIAVIRSWSALIGVLTLLCLYWLCRELFPSPITTVVAIGLLAVSPVHVLFAQEAREFSLWTATILLSSAALLRALRVRSRFSWGIYAGTVAIGLYTFLFSGLVMLGHGAYVLLHERLRWTRTVFAYLIASLIGILAFTPWLYFVIRYFEIIQATTGWTKEALPWWTATQVWMLNFSRIIVDFDFKLDNGWAYSVIIAALMLEVYAIYFVGRHAPKSISGFILTLMGGTILALAIPDLLLGGKRAIVSRYLFPCYLGVLLAVAYFISMQIVATSELRRRIGRGLFIAVVCVGIASCISFSQANTWWNKVTSYDHPTIAKILNQSTQPLFVTDAYATNPANAVALSYLVKPHVRFLLLPAVGSAPEIPTLNAQSRDIFLLNLPVAYRDRFATQYDRQPQHVIGELWQLEDKR